MELIGPCLSAMMIFPPGAGKQEFEWRSPRKDSPRPQVRAPRVSDAWALLLVPLEPGAGDATHRGAGAGDPVDCGAGARDPIHRGARARDAAHRGAGAGDATHRGA